MDEGRKIPPPNEGRGREKREREKGVERGREKGEERKGEGRREKRGKRKRDEGSDREAAVPTYLVAVRNGVHR